MSTLTSSGKHFSLGWGAARKKCKKMRKYTNIGKNKKKSPLLTDKMIMFPDYWKVIYRQYIRIDVNLARLQNSIGLNLNTFIFVEWRILLSSIVYFIRNGTENLQDMVIFLRFCPIYLSDKTQKSLYSDYCYHFFQYHGNGGLQIYDKPHNILDT